EVLKRLLTEHSDVFLCGSSSNEFEFFNLFDKVFILELDAPKHEERLRTRSSSYGKDAETLAWLMNERNGFANYARQLGAVAVDANGTPEHTVEQIIALT